MRTVKRRQKKLATELQTSDDDRLRDTKPSLKNPAYLWYPKDALSDEAYILMSFEQRGVYRHLLDIQWLNGSLPASVDALGTMVCMVPGEFERIWASIADRFEETTPGRLQNPRLERQRTEQARFFLTKAEAGRKAAAAKQARARRRQCLEAAKSRGTHTPEQWRHMLAVFSGRCCRCNRKKQVSKDHIIPVSNPKSTDSIGNIQPLCLKCNASKGQLIQDFRGDKWKQSTAVDLVNTPTVQLPDPVPASVPAPIPKTVVKNTTDRQPRQPMDLLDDPSEPTQVDALIKVWNEERQPGPRVMRTVPQARRKHYGVALRAKPNLDDWRIVIRYLNGEAWANAPGTGDHPNWRAHLDWLTRPGKLDEYLERARLDADSRRAKDRNKWCQHTPTCSGQQEHTRKVIDDGRRARGAEPGDWSNSAGNRAVTG